MNKFAIHDHATKVLEANDRLILQVVEDAAIMDIDPGLLKDAHGRPILAELLNTSALALNTLALTLNAP